MLCSIPGEHRSHSLFVVQLWCVVLYGEYLLKSTQFLSFGNKQSLTVLTGYCRYLLSLLNGGFSAP